MNFLPSVRVTCTQILPRPLPLHNDFVQSTSFGSVNATTQKHPSLSLKLSMRREGSGGIILVRLTSNILNKAHRSVSIVSLYQSVQFL